MLPPHKAMKAPSSNGGPGYKQKQVPGSLSQQGAVEATGRQGPSCSLPLGPAGLRLQAASSHGLQV